MDQQPEGEMRQRERPQQNYMIPLAIVIAGVIIAGGVYFSGKGPGGVALQPSTTGTQEAEAAGAAATAPATDTSTQLVPVTASDHILGSPNAPVTIVEYSDLECPFCKAFHQTMQQIMDQYGKSGQVAWVYRHFPLSQLHSKAPAEALASECVAKLGGNQAFWTFIDKIFAVTPSNNGLDDSLLPSFAKGAGVDEGQFNTCTADGSLMSVVNKEYSDALAVGAEGTPYSLVVVGGKVVSTINGAQPIEYVKSLIDSALASSTQSN